MMAEDRTTKGQIEEAQTAVEQTMAAVETVAEDQSETARTDPLSKSQARLTKELVARAAECIELL